MRTNAAEIRILHVDDEPDFTEMAATFLEGEDEQFSVATATSASEGLEHISENHVDCVISDYEMPSLDGVEFLEIVREENPDLPFILFTGKGSEVVASTAISAGVTDYLQKESGTSQFAVLANRIRNVVEGSAAQRERQRHLDAIETAQEGISILDDNRYMYVNEAYADLYGYEPEEMIGKHWKHIYPDEDVSEVHNEILPTLQETGRWHGRTTGLRADNSTFIEDHTLAMSENGKIVCTVRDVTEQERQQKRLEQTKARLELAVQGANLGVWDWDMRTDEVQYNEKWAEMIGHSLEAIEPHLDAWESRVHPNDIDDVETALQAHIEGETLYYDTEHRMETADGDWVWIRDVGKVVERNDAGEPIRAVGIHLDITEQKQHEQELEQEKSRLEEFTSIVSHDLRNPLNVAEGRMELARDECDSEHLDDAEEALGRMEELISDLLRLAKSGEHTDELVPVEIQAITDSCWQNVETADAAIVTETDRVIQADRSRVSQLFENLFRNAVEHGGTDVTITVGDLSDGFYIEDDGTGIAEADREKVFKTGYSSTEAGTGFGLSIVKQVADAHGWTITVTDGSEGGARFEITGVAFVRNDATVPGES